MRKKSKINHNIDPASNQAIAIARVSTLEQAHEERFSIPHQKAHIREECRKRGFDLIHFFEFVQSGARVLSGSSKEHDDIIRYINEHKVNYVLVHELDRLARSMLDTLLFVDELDKLGVRLISIHDNFDTSTPQGRLQMQILASFAEYFRKQLASKVMGGMIERAQKGLPLGKRPIGYTINSGGYGIIPEEAEIVKKIFELYINENTGLRGIADHLNKLGIRSRNNTLWSHATIRDILENEVYTGAFIWSNIRIESNHPAIIDRETFEKAQARRLTKLQLGGRSQNNDFLLSGLLKCGNCNKATMVGRTSRKGKYIYRYYRCNNYASKGVAACAGREYRAEELESIVLADIEELIKQEPIRFTEKEIMMAPYYNSLKGELALYEQELDKLGKSLERAAIAFETGQYDLDFFVQRKESIAGQKKELEEKVKELKTRLAGQIPPAEIARKATAKMQAAARLLKETSTGRAKIYLQEIIDHISVKNKDDVTIYYRL